MYGRYTNKEKYKIIEIENKTGITNNTKTLKIAQRKDRTETETEKRERSAKEQPLNLNTKTPDQQQHHHQPQYSVRLPAIKFGPHTTKVLLKRQSQKKRKKKRENTGAAEFESFLCVILFVVFVFVVY